ncbi:YncE family protein [Tengunoibacter tsumagoiensis]|uniref:YncE family protein n=1 Tax=Tengunoibacter tsumagoiensis TaxID=2014871 RepID=A0A401ZX24_9CHLR|nr:hypothetical protein [Tengunoibacter tsumagoiensis]GCE11376.1 hypothetical protein KTT_12350 [Tengunoibacter tsumagoiensis]
MSKQSYRWLLLIFLCSWLLLCGIPSVAKADGGAPNLAYVAGSDGGISRIDVMQQKVSGTISAAGKPSVISLSLDGRFLYAAQEDQDRVALIIAKTGEIFCTARVPGHPNRLVIDPNNSSIYAAGQGDSSVTIIDSTNCSIKRTLHVGGPVYGLAVAMVGSALSSNGAGGDQLWVSDSDSLTIFDDVSGKQLSQVHLAEGPRYLSIPPGATVYATTNQGSVVAVDLNSHTITTLITGGEYGPMDFNEGTGEIYVPDQKNKQLAVLAPVNSGFQPPKEPSRTVTLPARPASVAITSDGQLGFVALADGQVDMLDIPNHEQVAASYKVGGDPRFIITGLYPPSIVVNPSQASLLDNARTIAAYVLVAALFIVPFILFRRYAKARPGNVRRDEVKTKE